MAVDAWTGAAANNAWNDGHNWSLGVPPSATDIVAGPAQLLGINSATIGGAQLSGGSGITVYGGIRHPTLNINGPITGTGSLYISVGGVVNANSGVTSATGIVALSDNGTYNWAGSNSSQTITFGSSTFAGPSHFSFSTQFDGVVASFHQNDTIAYTGGNVSSISLNGQIATFSTGQGSFTIQFGNDVDMSALQVDPSTGSITTNQVAVCFVTGTRILTIRGEVAVEDLRVEDLVVTSSGEHRHIRWIGHQTIEMRCHRNPIEVTPVRISAGALGQGRPSRDLLVSPSHAICLNVLGEILIPAHALENGTTIHRQRVEIVTYWHVELDSHDILIAEGQPCESYLDMGNRGFFVQGNVVDLCAKPDGDPCRLTHADFCRPFVFSGVLLDAVRARIENISNVSQVKAA